ncbi:5-formyltetrahydrofolate cyclo-ligase [Flammeovirga aprica]|uniref:5-formyltetrahydrofolate cyclo-ligase n=1 Tax=Flammeovirga aprica JL-4 TaxID=694437 RepID=A0A7X9P0A4_9BACT|nr:5-formyltetrahydrofolate cyclo-ligase [Flammeovirga aprica]NME66652.1 5-formyltetrahydrofolate cyclo-ligase [Flammeovirga aprica JL-4]
MHNQKDTLRKEIIQQRNALSKAQIEKADKDIAATFWEGTSQEVAVLHTYIPINNEASTISIIQKALTSGWTVVVPKTLPQRQLKHLVLKDLSQLKEGKFGTLLPSEEIEYKGEIDFVLVPGVGFSEELGRMGYGGGYYDTFLVEYPNATKIGIGYDFQVIPKLPLEEHDVAMDRLIIAEV